MSAIYRTDESPWMIDAASRQDRPVVFASLLREALGLLRLWQTRVRLRRELRAMYDRDDCILKDIGLTRGDLHCEISKPFWR
jgi:uncharacterized protein YjiS (DUF1127 family)